MLAPVLTSAGLSDRKVVALPSVEGIELVSVPFMGAGEHASSIAIEWKYAGKGCYLPVATPHRLKHVISAPGKLAAEIKFMITRYQTPEGTAQLLADILEGRCFSPLPLAILEWQGNVPNLKEKIAEIKAFRAARRTADDAEYEETKRIRQAAMDAQQAKEKDAAWKLWREGGQLDATKFLIIFNEYAGHFHPRTVGMIRKKMATVTVKVSEKREFSASAAVKGNAAWASVFDAIRKLDRLVDEGAEPAKASRHVI